MVRPLQPGPDTAVKPAGAVVGAFEPLRRAVRNGVLGSSLASLIVHMLLAIGLGLWMFSVHAPRGHDVSLEIALEAGGGSGGETGATGLDGQSLDAAGQVPDVLLPHDMIEMAAPDVVGEQAFADLELSEPNVASPTSNALGAAANGTQGQSGAGTGRGNGRGAGQGDGNGPARTSLFGLEARGRRFVYVCDCSGSMSQAVFGSEPSGEFVRVAWTAARAELLRSLADLNDQQMFGIIFYNHEHQPFDPGEVYLPNGNRGAPRVRRWHERLFPASSENINLANLFVQSIRPNGETEHLMPLELAIRMDPDVIYVLTDAEAKDDLTLPQVNWLTRLNRKKATINVVQFAAQTRPDCTMIELARRNNGQHLFFNLAAGLMPINLAPPNGAAAVPLQQMPATAP